MNTKSPTATPDNKDTSSPAYYTTADFQAYERRYFIDRSRYRFKYSADLFDFLDICHQGKFKLLPRIPTLFHQPGPTCKLTAITNVLNYHFDEKSISTKPLTIMKEDGTSDEPTAESIVHKIGSEATRIYNEKMIKDFIKEYGIVTNDNDIKNAEVVSKRFYDSKDSKPDNHALNQQYIQFIKDTIDQGIAPPMIVFDVDHTPDRSGLPNATGTGSAEHGAIVIGYINTPNGLSFILGHWNHYYIVDAIELAISARNIKAGRQPDRYYLNIKNDRINCWFHGDTPTEMYDRIYYGIVSVYGHTDLAQSAIDAIAMSYNDFITKKKPDFSKENFSVSLSDEITKEELNFNCVVTAGCLYPIENDLRSTVLVIVPESLKLRLENQKIQKQTSQDQKNSELKSPGALSVFEKQVNAVAPNLDAVKLSDNPIVQIQQNLAKK